MRPPTLAFGRLWLPMAAPLLPHPFGLPHLCRDPPPKLPRCQGCPALALFISEGPGVCRASVGVLPGSRTALSLYPKALSAACLVFTCLHLVSIICSVGVTDVWYLQEDRGFPLCAQTAPVFQCGQERLRAGHENVSADHIPHKYRPGPGGSDPFSLPRNHHSATSSDLKCVLQECSEKRMHGNMFPTSPFVYYYDDECDIKRRANRLKRKVAGTVCFERSLPLYSSVCILETLWDYFHVLGKSCLDLNR